MARCRILHLCSQLLDLYGDYRNVDALCQRIEESGVTAEVDRPDLWDDFVLDGYDLVYLGHGTAANLAEAARVLVPHAEAIRAHVEAGQTFFVTGNAQELFGTSLSTKDGEVLPGIDLFPLRGIERNEVYDTDMVGTPVFDASQTIYGFVNRTAYLDGPNLYPLFRGVRGPDQGFESRGIEGILYRNFLSTWAMGPALVRNPFLMKEVLRRTLGENYQDDLDFSLEEQAHDLVVEEMRHGR